MTGFGAKASLVDYLQGARESLLWKLDGLGEYDIRRPFTPTGTNVLGLVKHAATSEYFYFSDVFSRPFGEKVAWVPDDLDLATVAELSPDEQLVDFWATAQESRDLITSFYQRVWVHSDATISEHRLDAPGFVPWWSQRGRSVTLREIMIHMVAETDRHAGQ